MTNKQYDNLKPIQAIQIISSIGQGRIVKNYQKHTTFYGEKGFIIGNMFYNLWDVKLVKEEK